MARSRSRARDEATDALVDGRRPLFRFKRKHEAFLRETAEAVATLQD